MLSVLYMGALVNVRWLWLFVVQVASLVVLAAIYGRHVRSRDVGYWQGWRDARDPIGGRKWWDRG